MFNDTQFTFKHSHRIATAKDYQSILRTGTRLKHRDFVIAVKPNQLEYPRLGVIVAKKQIGTAVKRNALKRKIRESFRLRRQSLPSLDIVFIIYKSMGAVERTVINKCLEEQWQKIVEKHKKSHSSFSEDTNIS